jgi:hypothetical protein
MKRSLFLLLLIGLLTGCAPRGTTQAPTPEVPPLIHPYVPQAGDALLTRDNVYLDEFNILILESYPVQFNLQLKGNLPTPCHQLRVSIADPDSKNRIYVDVYSVSDPNEICVQMLEPVDASIPLGSFPTGHYTVWVNGEQVGEFDA